MARMPVTARPVMAAAPTPQHSRMATPPMAMLHHSRAVRPSVGGAGNGGVTPGPRGGAATGCGEPDVGAHADPVVGPDPEPGGAPSIGAAGSVMVARVVCRVVLSAAVRWPGRWRRP